MTLDAASKSKKREENCTSSTERGILGVKGLVLKIKTSLFYK
jgi:hypothetical protein